MPENPVFHARTKHVEIHYHFIREKVFQGEINVEHTKIEHQTADLFTQGLIVITLENLGIVKTES